MSSNRLPGKVLRNLAGRPLLERVVSRARRIRTADDVVVATSTDATDDPIAHWCHAHDVPCYRGELNDVSARVKNCAARFNWDIIARVNADSPFLDPELIETGMLRAIENQLDFVTNIHPRSYPYGIAVEVFRADRYAAIYEEMDTPGDHEHVTSYFYRHAERLRHINLTWPHGNLSDIRLTVDNETDLRMASSIIARLGDAYEQATLRDVIACHRALAATEHGVNLVGV
jgi:spore coat polysaccharide biosynthesis protein SpsF